MPLRPGGVGRVELEHRAWAGSALTAIVLGAWMTGCSGADHGGTYEPSDSVDMGLAAATWRSGVAVGYHAATSTVDVATADGSVVGLRYTDDTTTVFIGDPEDFPAGFCRTIARRWETYVLSGA